MWRYSTKNVESILRQSIGLTFDCSLPKEVFIHHNLFASFFDKNIINFPAQKVFKIIVLIVLFANQIQQEKGQQRMLSCSRNTWWVLRMMLRGVRRRTLCTKRVKMGLFIFLNQDVGLQKITSGNLLFVQKSEGYMT